MEDLETQLCNFLSSSACVSWLKTALFLSTWENNSKDSTALTADVVEGLEAWLLARGLSGSHEATELVKNWIADFLGLMRDWGQALESSPFWIHCIPAQFLDEESTFKQALELGNEQSVMQLKEHQFLTARRNPHHWQSKCFTIDNERDLAYTWDQNSGFVSCVHLGTGLLAAETRLVPEAGELATMRLVRGTSKC